MTFKLFKSLNTAFLAVTVAANILFLACFLPAPAAGAVVRTVWVILALIPLDLALVLGFNLAADRKYVSVALALSRDLDVAAFQKANAPIRKRLEAHPELNRTTVGFAVRMNEACAMAEAGEVRQAAEAMKTVLYDPSIKTRKRIYGKALLQMARLLYCLGEPEGADRCVEELEKVRDGLTEKDGAAARQEIGRFTLRAEAARAAYEGRAEDARKLLERSGDEKERRLERTRLACLSAFAASLAGDGESGKATLDGLDADAQRLFACAETRRRCGWEE